MLATNIKLKKVRMDLSLASFLQILTFFILILFSSCDPPLQQSSTMPPEYKANPDAQESFDRLTDGGRDLPSSVELNEEINSNGTTERLHSLPCETCGLEIVDPVADNSDVEVNIEQEVVLTRLTTDGAEIDEGSDNYDVSNREQMVAQIITNGPDSFGTTQITVNGKCLEVMNDSPTLPDGTYVPFTQVEAKQMAQSWNWKIPNLSEAQAIRQFAEQQGNVLNSITRTNVNNAQRLNSMTELFNDERMKEYAQAGRSNLINGHFKWYIQHDSKMKIYGLRRNGTNSYWQNSASSAHSSQEQYVDYSHGVRLVRPCP